MTGFIAKRVAKDVPIWDLLVDGADIGLLTDFPGEGPVATIKAYGVKETFYSSATIHEALYRAKVAFLELQAGTHYAQEQEPDYIEDEDGSEAFVRMLERRAEERAEVEDNFYPIF